MVSERGARPSPFLRRYAMPMKSPYLRVSKTLILLVALVLILAGVLKLINVGAEDMLEGLQKAHLSQHQQWISLTAILCGVLLVIPGTERLGWLMATAYWGGAIVAHMTYNDSILMPAAFLCLLWGGILLRERVTAAEQAST